MRRILTTTVLTYLILLTQSAEADGLLYQLPKDGAYVLYDLDINLNRGEQNITAKGSFKLSSVGTVTEKGKKCRWIEFKMKFEMDGNERVVIGKVLIPEAKLKEGENAFDSKIRGWVQLGAEAEVQEIDENNAGPMAAFLCGPLSDSKKLKPSTIDSKIGKLECAGVSGHTKYQERGRDAKATFETRRHKKAPFGVVSTVLSIESERNGQFQQQAKMTFTLKEVGKDAKSELADSK